LECAKKVCKKAHGLASCPKSLGSLWISNNPSGFVTRDGDMFTF